MDLEAALLVGMQDRPDEEHGRARRPHQRRQNGARAQKQGVDGRRGLDVAAQMDAARDGEQGAQQDDEGDVVEDEGMKKEGGVAAGEEDDDDRQAEGQGDEKLVEVFLPEAAVGQGQDRDGQQKQPERRHFHGSRL